MSSDTKHGMHYMLDLSVLDVWQKTPSRLNSQNRTSTSRPVVDVMKDMANTVKWPTKTIVPIDARAKNKHCDFHNNHQHTTDECISLHYKVIKLLKRGHLVDVLTEKRRQNQGRKQEPQQQPKQPLGNRILNCITGAQM